MLQLLAHAAEFHTDSTTVYQHWLGEWWFGMGLYAIFLALVLWGLNGKLSLASRLTTVLAVSLVIGLVFYRWTPLLSGVAIVVGFATSLILGLGAAKGSK